MKLRVNRWSWAAAVFRLCSLVLLLATASGCEISKLAGGTHPGDGAKQVSFAVLEDYDKGQDLNDIAKDFQLMRELGIDVLRCSLGWDDYEPAPGRYDFTWLKEFARLAAQHEIKLRPYIGYTPRCGRSRQQRRHGLEQSAGRLHRMASFRLPLALALRDYPNVLSYEIYNEQNARLWWDGSIAQYKATLRHSALAIRMADPDAQVLLGGFVLPDVDWLRAITQDGYARYYHIAPFHAYPETWTTADVVVENYLDERYREFVRQNQTAGDGEPIWINEMGFAVVPGSSERDQANWWARAVSTFLADPAVEHIGVYEIKDRRSAKKLLALKKTISSASRASTAQKSWRSTPSRC